MAATENTFEEKEEEPLIGTEDQDSVENEDVSSMVGFKKQPSTVDDIDDANVFHNEEHDSELQSSDADLTEDENMTGEKNHESTYVLPSTKRRKSSVNTMWEPGVVWKGEFLKQSHYRGEWRKRYFVLMKSNDLRYFADSTQQNEMGCLNISEDTQFIAEENIDLDIVCNDRTWHLRFYTTEARDVWKEKFEETQKSKSLGSLKFSGYLSKLGSPIPLWKLKYAKLYANMSIKFYNHHSDSMVTGIGTISPINKMTQIERENKDVLDWPYEFNIETDERTWKFRTRTEDQLNLWMECISSSWESWEQLTEN